MGMKKKVVVAMSGGVDSSVAAALLQQQGYDCVGVFMRLGNDPADLTDADLEQIACSPEKRSAHEQSLKAQASSPKAHHQGCCSSSDAADARYVAGLLNIPFYALNFQHDFGGIIDYFVREYNRGRTPNPCVRCNEYLKFGKLSRYAKAIGADYVATGHYARIVHGETPGEEPRLLRGKDPKKDQSYVLFGVPRAELAHMLLPIGDMEKSHVRELAQKFGLPVFNKPDSQEICFVPDNDYARLVKKKTPELVTGGTFVDSAGKALGRHGGHQHFTIGQRRGIGLAFGHPIYVTHIDADSNTVTIGEKEDLMHRSLIAREVNWIVGDPRTPRTPSLSREDALRLRTHRRHRNDHRRGSTHRALR